MTLETAEIGFWFAITLWVIAFLFFLRGLVFNKASALPRAVMFAWLGLLPLAAGMAMRWMVSGRPPFISLYELVVASAWFAVATFLLVQVFWRLARPIGVVVLPVAFISMGAAMTATVEANPLGATLKSWWLVIHILFAMLALGGFAISFGAGILLLFRKGKDGPERDSPIPAMERLDQMSVRCIVFGFICHTIMVLSGSIWAHRAWGRYWGWDPTEVWSLFAWLLYGLYLHLRFLPGWRGRRAAIFAVIAFPIMVFSFWGIPHLWESVHDYMIYPGELSQFLPGLICPLPWRG